MKSFWLESGYTSNNSSFHELAPWWEIFAPNLIIIQSNSNSNFSHFRSIITYDGTLIRRNNAGSSGYYSSCLYTLCTRGSACCSSTKKAITCISSRFEIATKVSWVSAFLIFHPSLLSSPLDYFLPLFGRVSSPPCYGCVIYVHEIQLGTA